jgi:DNA-binding response OmpR family regulator
MCHRLLIVEDDPALRSLLERYLPHFGYAVAGAGSAEEVTDEALDHCDLVLIDLTLPGAPGESLAARARLRNPEAGILLTSGHPFTPRPGFGFLQKPFSPDQLAAALETLRKA